MVCDFREVVIEQQAENRVRISAAKGRAPSSTYKVSATQLDGFRCAGSMVIIGIDAEKKARRTAEAIIERTSDILREMGLPPFTSTYIEVIGAESLYGPHARARDAREVMVRVVANHPQKAALAMFSREIAPSGTRGRRAPPSPAAAGPRCRR